MFSRSLGFMTGIIVGSGIMYFVLLHHVVRAKDGWHVVDKVDACLSDAYVDIRGYNAEDWQTKPNVVSAINNSRKNFLLNDSNHDLMSQPSYDYWDVQPTY